MQCFSLNQMRSRLFLLSDHVASFFSFFFWQEEGALGAKVLQFQMHFFPDYTLIFLILYLYMSLQRALFCQ